MKKESKDKDTNGSRVAAQCPHPYLIKSVNETSKDLEKLTSNAQLEWGLEQFNERFVLTTSFGIQSAVLLHMTVGLKYNKKPKVIWIDTCYLPKDTYNYAEELTNLLISWYEDEVLYQEALSRGFDSDDEIVRRRLIQKYKDFIKTQAFNYVPTNEELRNFYDKNSVKYVEPFSISFSHNFFKTKNTNQTDIFFSGSSFSYVDQIKVDSTFGEGFFQKILENNGKRINSIYGWHEIKNLQIYPEKLISYEKVK